MRRLPEEAEKKITALTLAAPLLLFSLSGDAALDFELYAKLASTVMKIEAHNPDGSTSIGSGVMVAPGKLVTNCHVPKNASSIQVIKSGLRWQAVKQQSNVECALRKSGRKAIAISKLAAAFTWSPLCK